MLLAKYPAGLLEQPSLEKVLGILFIPVAQLANVGETTLDRLTHAVPCFPTMSGVCFNLVDAAAIKGRPDYI